MAELIKYGFDPTTLELEDEIPIEYVTGWVTFAGRSFAVSPATLIPRVETEELIELVLTCTQTRQAPQPLRILDVGTGSGAIGITLQLELNQRHQPAYVYLSDVSAEALEVAQSNVRHHLPHHPISLVESDLLNAHSPSQRFDIIVANLPYIPNHLLSELDQSVRDFEPWLALDGGEYGLEVIHQLLKQAPRYLAPQGIIWLEIDQSQTAAMIDPQNTYDVTIIKDSFERSRFAQLKLKH